MRILGPCLVLVHRQLGLPGVRPICGRLQGARAMVPWLVLGLVLAAAPTWARTFYVDPATGANTNDGTSCATPWMNPPGTIKTSGTCNPGGGSCTAAAPCAGGAACVPSFWGASTWTATGGCGTINGTTCKIACGDTILLRGGQTYTRTQGGAWCIAGSYSGSGGNDDCTNLPVGAGKLYYASICTASSPITIRVATAAEWTAGVNSCTATSSGNFVFDGTGLLPASTQFHCSSSGGGICAGVMLTNGANGLIFGGASDSRRLEFINSPIPPGSGNKSYAFAVHTATTTETGILTDEQVQWLYIHDSVRAMTASGVKNSIFQDSIIDHVAHSCWITAWAGSNTNVHNVGFVRDTARRCASRGDVNGGSEINSGMGEEDAYNGFVGYRVWTVDSSALDSYERGWDFGGHPRAACGYGPVSSHHRNFRAINNGRGVTNALCYNSTCQSGRTGVSCTQPGDCCVGAGNPAQCCTGVGTGPQCRAGDGGNSVNSGSGSICDAAGLCATDCTKFCNSDGDCTGKICANNSATCTGDGDCTGGAHCIGCSFNGPYSVGGTVVCAGHPLNGCANITIPLHADHFFLGGVMFKGADKGTMVYGGGRMEVWNTTLFGDGWDGPGSGEIAYDKNGVQSRTFNSIVQARPYGRSAWQGPNNASISCEPNKPLTGNNLFRYATAASELLSGFSCPTTACRGAGVTFANGTVANTGFTSASDLVAGLGGSAQPANFISTPGATCDRDPRSTHTAGGDYGTCSGGITPGQSCAFDHDCPGGGTCALNCNLGLGSGSAAIDSGRCYMKTANSGSSSIGPMVVTTNDATLAAMGGSPPSAGAVRTNAGGSYNPNDYFMDTTTFLGAVPDTINIGGTTVRLANVGLTEATCSGCSGGNFPTGCTNGTVCHYAEDCVRGSCAGGALTVTTPISWTSGQCVHLQYSGAAPDIGAFESGGASSGAPGPPTLISVQPVP